MTRPIPGARPGCLFTIYPADGHEKVRALGLLREDKIIRSAMGRGHFVVRRD